MSVYGTLADLYKFGAPERSLASFSDSDKLTALEAASEIADSYIRARWPLPLLSWDLSLTQAVCKIAAAELLGSRGYNPATGADPLITQRKLEALEWLRSVQRQQAHPNLISATASGPSGTAQQPMVISSSVVDVSTGRVAARRGW